MSQSRGLTRASTELFIAKYFKEKEYFLPLLQCLLVCSGRFMGMLFTLSLLPATVHYISYID